MGVSSSSSSKLLVDLEARLGMALPCVRECMLAGAGGSASKLVNEGNPWDIAPSPASAVVVFPDSEAPPTPTATPVTVGRSKNDVMPASSRLGELASLKREVEMLGSSWGTGGLGTGGFGA